MIEKQLAASHDDGQNVIQIMRDSARELSHYFHFLDVAQPLFGFAVVAPHPPLAASVGIEHLYFTASQDWVAYYGLFLLHCYQPPNLSRSVRFKNSKGHAGQPILYASHTTAGNVPNSLQTFSLAIC